MFQRLARRTVGPWLCIGCVWPGSTQCLVPGFPHLHRHLLEAVLLVMEVDGSTDVAKQPGWHLFQAGATELEGWLAVAYAAALFDPRL